MPRVKKQSTVLPLAEKRVAGMKLINTKLNLGGGCTVATMEAQITTARQKLKAYHDLLSQADAAANDLEEAEQDLNRLSNKVLPGVAVLYDKDSNEYEMVGGTRPSDRKRAKRQSEQLAMA